MIPIRKWTVVLLVIIVAALSVSGCLGTKLPPSSAQSPPALLLDYHRTGGFAGVDDHLIIFNNGAGVISTRSATREFQLNDSETEQLQRIFQDAGFDTLEAQYLPGPGSADLMTYRIVFQNKTVVTEDTAIPFPLQSVIRELNAIVATRVHQDPGSGSLPRIRT